MNGLVPAWSVWLLLGLTLLGANLPYLNQRLFAVGPLREPKSNGWHVAELLVYGLLVGLAGRALEAHVGQPSALRWEWFVIWATVFLTLGFPGFVWRYLRRGGR